MKKVVCVHTAMALVGPLTETFRELIPEVQVEHIAESSLIKEVIANNAVTPAVRRRLLDYLAKKDIERYRALIAKLGIRK
mgnify:CR=1 FL=1